MTRGISLTSTLKLTEYLHSHLPTLLFHILHKIMKSCNDFGMQFCNGGHSRIHSYMSQQKQYREFSDIAMQQYREDYVLW